MSSGVAHDREEIAARWEALDAAFDAVGELGYDALTDREVVSFVDRIERMNRRLPAIERPLLTRLADASPVALGAKSLREVLRSRLRISPSEAGRRLDEAKELGPRTALSGEPLEPLLVATAKAQAAGRINGDHVRVIRGFFNRLPHWVDVATREHAEVDLVSAAVGLDPKALGEVADRLLALIDQDGPMPDDTERARRRYLTIGKQGADGMIPFKGNLDPQTWATLEAAFAKWAAPGMCNPDDETPCVKGTPSQEQIQGDTRTLGQRQHDALTAIGRSVLSSGEFGQHNGLPVTIIVSTTLTELESAAGRAVTGGGTLLPMSDVIRMASHAYHYLAIFDQHTGEALYLGRTRRCASPAQRIVLHARDRGCTAPGCSVPGYGCQVHHIDGWAKADGQTNIDAEVLACKGHNLMAEDGWTVRMTANGRVEWIPPPHLDTGQARTNTYHHPERMFVEPDAGGGVSSDLDPEQDPDPPV
jgi:Domain of unknown function (DUF222)